MKLEAVFKIMIHHINDKMNMPFKSV